jgi:uncharacterized membrane protein
MALADIPRLLRRLCAAWPAALVLAACSPAPEAPASTAPVHTLAAPEASSQDTFDAQGQLRGFYEGREGGLFTACGETSRRHVRELDAKALAVLSAADAADPEPKFIVASGNLIGRDGVAIAAIDLVTRDAFSCESRLDDIILAARGTQSLWTLEVTAAAVDFIAAPGATPQLFPYRPVSQSQGKRVLESSNADGGIRIELQPGPCSEKMTGTTFGLAANVQTGGQVYSGCAWRGLARP